MAGWLLLRVACRASSESSLKYCCPTPHKAWGWDRQGGRGHSALAAGRPGRAEATREETREGLIRCSMAMARHHCGAQSSIHAGGDAGVSWGNGGCRKTPPEGLKSNPVKQRHILHRADEHFSNTPLIADGPKCTEIVALLAEILVLDYQEHKKITVGSPPQSNRNIKLNSLRLVQDEE